MLGRWGRGNRLRVLAVLALAASTVSMFASAPRQREVKFIVGKYKVPAPPTPTPKPRTPPPVYVERPDPVFSARPILTRGGKGPGKALAFHGPSLYAVPKDLLFFLVIGSDARPGEDMTRTRADSLHIAAVDPKSMEGTILGIPRDSYVDIPGRGKHKINAALVYGGPNLLVETVRNLTHIPITYYAITGFEGIRMIVDDLHGVDVQVPYEMHDQYSGADFSKGWHHMDGPQVLSFSRARHGVPGGDFGRSENQGRVILDSLMKLRAETSDAKGVKKWMEILYKHAKLNMGLSDAMKLALIARQMLPAKLRNVVTPGTPQYVGDQSVVILGDDAQRLFKDVAADAVADGDLKRQTPLPTPTPRPTPTPGIIGRLLPGL